MADIIELTDSPNDGGGKRWINLDMLVMVREGKPRTVSGAHCSHATSAARLHVSMMGHADFTVEGDDMSLLRETLAERAAA